MNAPVRTEAAILKAAQDPKTSADIEVYNALSEKAVAEQLLGDWNRAASVEQARDSIEACLGWYERALSVITRDRLEDTWAQIMAGMALALTRRLTGDPETNVELAIRYYRAALGVHTRTRDPRVWAQEVHNLALAYASWLGGDRRGNIEEAIALYQQALEVRTPQDDPAGYGSTMLCLVGAYVSRIAGERGANIEQALTTTRAALEVVTPTMPGIWGALENNLGIILSERIAGSRSANIEEAIAAYKDALTVRTRETNALDWAGTTSNLGIAYRLRAEGDRAENLELARTAQLAVLSVFSEEQTPGQWASATTNLGNVYMERIRGDRLANLEESIACLKAASEVRLKLGDRLEWARALSNLGFVYLSRQTGDPKQNIEDAINALTAALPVLEREGTRGMWADAMIHLGSAYTDRSVGSPEDNLSQAITCLRAALPELDAGKAPLAAAMAHNNLGNVYQQQGNATGAIVEYQAALQARPEDADPVRWAQTMNNLGNAYRSLAIEQPAVLEQAITAYTAALKVLTPTSDPDDCRRTATSLAQVQAKLGHWQEAAAAYQQALDGAESLYRASLLRSSQETELAEAGNLAAEAAYVLARAGSLAPAIETLERGRARGVADAFAADRAQLERLRQDAPDVYQQYADAAARLRDLERSELAMPDDADGSLLRAGIQSMSIERTAARASLEQAIESIRRVAGLERFLQPPDLDDILAVSKDEPLVYLAAATPGGFAMLATAEISCVWLDALTLDSLRDRVNTYWDAYQGHHDDQARWSGELDDITRWLWDAAIGPLVAQLGTAPATTIVAFGPLGLLPLHAAWIPDATAVSGRRYALDAMLITYAPNALALRAARGAALRTVPDSLLMVAEPSPVDAPPLPNAPNVAAAAAAYFEKRLELAGPKATLDGVRSELPHYSVQHFECHARADVLQPLESGLLLADNESLTLRDLLASEIPGTRISVLSACETAVVGAKLPDEVLSLPTGLLQAGTAGVVASMWKVTDQSTALLMFRFYELWLKEKLAPREALRDAMRWLRDSSNGDLVAYLERFTGGAMAPALVTPATSLWTELAFEPPETRDYEHPRYWAAFAYTGA